MFYIVTIVLFDLKKTKFNLNKLNWTWRTTDGISFPIILPIMYGKSEWKIEGMNSKMNYLHECCVLLMEKSENLNSQISVGISSGLDAVKSQNFSIFTGATVDTAVGNPMNFVS